MKLGLTLMALVFSSACGDVSHLGYPPSKLGSTKTIISFGSTATLVRLVAPQQGGTFNRASFVMQSTQDVRIVQGSSSMDAVTATTGFKLLKDGAMVWRIDVDSEDDNHISIIQDSAAGKLELTLISAVSGTGTTPTIIGTSRIVAFGDSLTLGFPDGGGYRIRLKELAGNNIRFYGQYANRPLSDPAHEGVNGLKANAMTSRMTTALSTYTPDIVLLMAGTNDFNAGETAADTLTVMAALAQQVLDTNALCIVGKIPYSTNFADSITDAYNDGLLGAMPAGTYIAAVGNTLVQPTDFVDASHPNQGGYDKMADGWWDALESLIALNI